MFCEYCDAIEDMTGNRNCPIHNLNETIRSDFDLLTLEVIRLPEEIRETKERITHYEANTH